MCVCSVIVPVCRWTGECHYFHGVVPLLEFGGEVRWVEARELLAPQLLVEAPALLLPPPPGRLLARELGGSSGEHGYNMSGWVK